MTDTNERPSITYAEQPRADQTAVDPNRRDALRRLGYAAAVAPAMLVLMKGRSEAVPACDNPAWDLGLSRKGHSGC